MTTRKSEWQLTAVGITVVIGWKQNALAKSVVLDAMAGMCRSAAQRAPLVRQQQRRHVSARAETALHVWRMSRNTL